MQKLFLKIFHKLFISSSNLFVIIRVTIVFFFVRGHVVLTKSDLNLLMCNVKLKKMDSTFETKFEHNSPQ